MKLIKSLFTLFLLALGISIASGVNLAYTTPAVVAAAFLIDYSKMPLQAALDNVDVSALSRYATNFQRSLIKTLVNGMDIAMDIRVYPGVKNYVKLPKLLVGNGFRPFSSTTEFGTSTDLTFSDRELKTEAGKRELLIDAEKFRTTYLSEVMTPGSPANKKEIPFAQFVWQSVIEQVQSEINDETAYFGFDKSTAVAYAGGSTYSPGDYITFTQNGKTEYFLQVDSGDTTAGQSPDTHPAKWQKVTARAVVPGIGSYIAAEVSGGGIVPVATGAITATAGVAETAFLKLFRAMPEAIKKNGVVIHCSYTDFEFLIDDLVNNQKYTVTDISSQMVNGMLPMPRTNRQCFVKPATWLSGSRRLIANPLVNGRADNMIMGTDLLSDVNTINTKENLWTLEAGLKFVLGFQIADLDAIRVGNQA